MNLRQKFERFMRGRYGTDKFSTVLIWMALGVMVVNSFFQTLFLYLIQFFLIGYAFFRMFSRNIEKRLRENRKFEAVWRRIIAILKNCKARWKDRKTHVYTKCPGCKATLRSPRKKGHHTVRCPRCNQTFKFKCK